MTVSLDRLTFAEYLNYNDSRDRRYELVNGELMPTSLGTGQHGAIIKSIERSLEAEIASQNLDWVEVR